MSQSRRLDFVLLLGLVVLPAARAEEGVRSVAASATTITIAGSSSHRILRIVELLPDQGADAADTAAVIAEARPAGERFSVGAPRFDGERDRLYSGFLPLRRDGDDWTPVGTHRFVEEFTGLAAYDTPFPESPSKKGLQVQMVDDALELGVKHAALNVNFSQLVDLRGRDDSLSWRVDGRTVHFHRRAVESLDRQIRPLTDAGVVVSLILLAYQSGDPELDRTLLHPDYSPEAPNRLGAFNTITSDGVLHFRACVGFLAHRYLDPAQYGGRVANYILGNEVNSHWFWANRGRVTMEAFADDYLRTARIAHVALRTASPSARLYLSLEHHWTIRYPGGDELQAFPGRPFLEYFNSRAREHGDFDWHLAFHPYPENLFEPRTWNDRSAPAEIDAPRITFRNIDLLPQFLRRPEFLCRGAPRRIILSEQGFHTPDGPDGELIQAAAYAYAYRKVADLEGIDAFILHRHVDYAHEGGLRLGLWTRRSRGRSPAEPAARKLIYDVFRAADMPDWRESFQFALPVIGIEGWEELQTRQ